MKKTISIILMIFLLISLGVNSTNAATTCSINASANKTSINVGDSVTVTVSFSPAVGTADFTLNYDKSILQLTGNSSQVQLSGDRVTYIDYSGKTISSASFTFKSKKAGTAKVSVAAKKFSDKDANRLTASVGRSASITVKNPNQNTNTNTNTNNTNTNKPNNSTNTNSNKPTNSNSNNGSTSSKNDDPTFKNVNQTVYAKSQVNVRKSWSTSSAQLGVLQEGDSIKRTGTGSNGWDRVTYKGQTAYINSSYLTTTKPKDDDKDGKNNETKNEIANETTNNTVTNEVNNNEINNNEVNNNEVSNNEIDNAVTNTSSNSLENNQMGSQTTDEKQPNYVLYIIIVIIVIAIVIIIIVSILENKRNRKNRRK